MRRSWVRISLGALIVDGIDPICGMVGKIPAHGHYFCCTLCIEKYEQMYHIRPKSYKDKIPAILLVGILLFGGIFCIYNREFMTYFMGIVLVSLSVLKIIDWGGFIEAFRMYDLIAKKSLVYASVYPIIELSAGILLIMNIFIRFAAVIVVLVTFIGSISSIQIIYRKRSVRCACMGTRIKVPMTAFTLVENLVMFGMAMLLITSFSW